MVQRLWISGAGCGEKLSHLRQLEALTVSHSMRCSNERTTNDVRSFVRSFVRRSIECSNCSPKRPIAKSFSFAVLFVAVVSPRKSGNQMPDGRRGEVHDCCVMRYQLTCVLACGYYLTTMSLLSVVACVDVLLLTSLSYDLCGEERYLFTPHHCRCAHSASWPCLLCPSLLEA